MLECKCLKITFDSINKSFSTVLPHELPMSHQRICCVAVLVFYFGHLANWIIRDKKHVTQYPGSLDKFCSRGSRFSVVG